MKIGVVGNGMIVERFLSDIPEVDGANVCSLCVREKSLDKGKALAETYHIPNVKTNYEEFLADPEMNAVYIGISNHMHYSYVKQALLAGKHVICEKPFTVHSWETEELAALALEKRLFLWEAFKIPYSPIYQAVRDRLPELGRIRMVQCNYSRVSSRYKQYQQGIVLPAFDPEMAGGCLYDINLYNLHFVTGLFGKPEQVIYHANLGFNGVDTSGIVFLSYPDFPAVCCGAKDSSSPCGAVIQGENGYIRIEGPASSAKKALICKDKDEECFIEFPDNGELTEELQEFVRQFLTGDYDSCYKMLEHSRMMMQVLEQAASSATSA